MGLVNTVVPLAELEAETLAWYACPTQPLQIVGTASVCLELLISLQLGATHTHLQKHAFSMVVRLAELAGPLLASATPLLTCSRCP